MAVLIGTSGWSYDHWVGVLYPKSAKSLERLDAYTRHFRTVEVNNTFYRWPKDEVFSTWRERSPEGFVFSAKASRGLTQFRRLKDPEAWLERMEAGLTRLKEKRGPLLVQLPPHFPLDLDPGKAPFSDVIAVARAIKSTLDEEGADSFVKTSGKTGLHVLTPWTQEGGFDEARAWALKLAERTAEAMPRQATVDIRKARRGDRVYIDVMQNARGHHAVPPYVLRAVPGATVSIPLDWKEVAEELDPKAFTPKKALARFTRRKTDPFEWLLESFAGRRKKAAKD